MTPTESPCVLCATDDRAGELLFEDASCRVLLHPDWSPRGHAMVIARRHVENASDLDEETWLQFARTWQRAEGILLRATGAARAMILKLGVMTPHLHVHIYPVPATDTREEVFAAFDGQRSEPRDEDFVSALRKAFT